MESGHASAIPFISTQSLHIRDILVLVTVPAVLLFLFRRYQIANGDDKFPRWILIEGYLVALCMTQGGILRKIACVPTFLRLPSCPYKVSLL